MGEARPLIVHIIHHLFIGGMENGLVNLVNLLPASRYRHAIVCIEDYSDFGKRISNPDTAVYAMHRRGLSQAQLYWRLFRLFRSLRPAIVHSRNRSGLDGLVPALAAGVRIRVHGEHGWDVDDIDGQSRKLRNLRKLHRPFVSHYTCVSDHLRRYMIERVRVAPKDITQIYNGVDIGRFKPQAESERRALALVWGGSARFVIGAVGRLQPVKNQRDLIRAVSLLVRRSPHLRDKIGVVIVGDGSERSRLEAQVQEEKLQDVIKFLGARNDIADLLPEFDVFVLPSLAEGISNTILEAMASGVPVVATLVGGNPELVDEGMTGRLIPSTDVDAMARAIEEYVSDPALARRHGHAGRQAVARRFSIERMVGDYASLYDGLLARRATLPSSARASS
jgi:sugar transferase (PEP-CTERM/EpsH1 system associated)